MRSNEVPPPIPTKRHSRRTIASSELGVISIISASIALMTTILMKDDMKVVSGGGGWVFVFFLFVIPLMLLSFITSIIGICLSSETSKGKRLNLIGLMLTFSPILMVIIIMKIQNWQRETHDKKNYSYVDEVKFNKEKKELIKYPKNKKGTKYTIPDRVTYIKDTAFLDCKSLTKITIPDSVTSIGDGAFSGCSNLTTITIPNSVTSIGRNMMQGCINLININVSNDNLEYADIDGVLYNKPLTELIIYPTSQKSTSYTIPDSVSSIEFAAFFMCNRLTKIIIPKSVTHIKAAAFTGCSSLTNIEIPDSVATIENFAFQSSKSLMSVTIGDGIMKIGDGVFQNCGNLKTVIFLGGAPKVGKNTFRILGGAPKVATVTIYRKPEAKGWGDTWGGRPVKLISEKP